MKVPADGGKYQICSDDSGRTWVERHGEVWIDSPPGSKMLISVAFELACLRRISRAAEKMLDALASDALPGAAAVAELRSVLHELDGYTDFRASYQDPGEI